MNIKLLSVFLCVKGICTIANVYPPYNNAIIILNHSLLLLKSCGSILKPLCMSCCFYRIVLVALTQDGYDLGLYLSAFYSIRDPSLAVEFA